MKRKNKHRKTNKPRIKKSSRHPQTNKRRRRKRQHLRQRTERRRNRAGKVHKAALRFLRDSTFLFRIGRKLAELGVVNEDVNRLILVLAFLARVSVIIKGPSAAGKSSLLSKCTQILPREFVVRRSTLSRKAPVHGDNSWEGKVLCLTEHVGGKDAQFLLRLMQSEDAVEDERTVIAGKKTGTVVTQVSGGLIIFTTTTQEKVYADDETRALSITIDISPGQTLAILQARLSLNQETLKKREERLEVFQEALRILARAKKDIRFLYPAWLYYVATKIPLDQIRVRRDWERFLQFLEAIALCRKFSGGIEDSRAIEISFVDYCVAYSLLNSVFSSTLQGVREQEMEIAKAVRTIYDNNKRPVAVREIAEHLRWERPKVYKYIDDACRHGLIRYDVGTKPQNRKPVLPGVFAAQDFLPSPTQVLNANKELGDIAKYVDPLTGLLIPVTRTKTSPTNSILGSSKKRESERRRHEDGRRLHE